MNDLAYQETKVNAALHELRIRCGLTCDQMNEVRVYLNYVYSIGYNRASAESYKCRPVQQISKGKVLAIHPSIKAASQATGTNERGIGNALAGRCNSAGGFFWKYLEK